MLPYDNIVDIVFVFHVCHSHHSLYKSFFYEKFVFQILFYRLHDVIVRDEYMVGSLSSLVLLLLLFHYVVRRERLRSLTAILCVLRVSRLPCSLSLLLLLLSLHRVQLLVVAQKHHVIFTISTSATQKTEHHKVPSKLQHNTPLSP